MLNNLKPTEGSRKARTRRCRGLGSGLGKNGGTGNKGQNSRTGGGVRLGFEGGQLPLFRRLPKRGFKHYGKLEYATINVGDLNKFEDGAVVDMTALIEANLIKKELLPTEAPPRRIIFILWKFHNIDRVLKED